MLCDSCQCEVPAHKKDCPSCGRDCGFPNVRYAVRDSEVKALSQRIKDAEVSTESRGCVEELHKFGRAVAKAKAVISRPLAKISDLIADEKRSYVSFQREVEAGLRSPEDNEFDKVRKQYEEALYPHFSKEILFASLSLSEIGMSGYGTHAMVIKDEMISHRATVFEENPHRFVEKHGVLLNESIPVGYRATWDNRGSLAMAKLHSRIAPGLKSSQYASILETDNGGSGDSDWIEVHIFGSLNRNAIESVSGAIPKTRADRIIWDALKSRLEENNISVHEI